MSKHPLPLVVREKEAEGYELMSGPYQWPTELWMLDNAIGDVKRQGKRYAVVRCEDSRTLWLLKKVER